MASLFSQNIGLNYKGILNLDSTINTPLDATLRAVTDGMGTSSPLQLSTTQVAVVGTATANAFTVTNAAGVSMQFGYGGGATNYYDAGAGGNQYWRGGTSNYFQKQTIIGSVSVAPTAMLHVRGDGTNPIVLFQDNSGTSQLYITNAGSVIFANQVQGPLLRASTNLACSSFTNQSYNGTAWLTIDDTWSTQSYATKTIALTAGATNPKMFSYAYTINNSGAQTGTATGIFLNATETALNGMTHNLMDLQVGGVSKFKVDNNGQILLALNAGLKIGTARFVTNNSSFYIGDVDNNTLSKVTYRSLGIDSLIMNGAILQLSGSTSSFPAIKRNGAAIDFRKADDSAYCNINAEVVSCSTITTSANIQVGNILYSNNFWNQSDGGTTIGAQAVPTTSSILDVRSTTKGFLPPRMTTTQKNAISTPATGLVVFDTTLVKLAVYNGAAWETVTSV